jgi:YjbE family integral membrane protein
MEFFSAPWLSALLAIVLIDLVLAGDNAIVIALAARQLPQHLQKKAIVWGTVGAIVVRSAMTVGVVWLLKIPGLMLVGGLGLVWVAYKLLVPQNGGEGGHQPVASTFWGAMKTIVIADALMGIDNVLGVAGAAKGSFDLVIIGLLISVPIVVWGSTLVLKLVERFPVITYVGAGVLAYTAAHMVVSEPLLDAVFDPSMLNRVLAHAVLIVGVLGAGWWTARRMQQRAEPLSQ